MARLTVEDCLPFVDNRFDLVLKAAKRARQIEKGAEPQVPWNHDKPTVLSLREIALGIVNTTPASIAESSDTSNNTEVHSSTSAEIDEFIAQEMPVVAEPTATPESPETAAEE